ncbi:SsgA family sporulation/cell division regulator [Amycolatopsis minnesotensis]|uniref:SsgA family sporulation/cell division regulator n=1 Tax=Amycolatopsis minnesotensis TaxID=337894 RepID=A0ABN2QQ58_9PSEU
MGNEHRSASAEVVFGLRTFGANPLPVRVELEYDSDDPYAVVAAFHSGRGTVRWMFSRDLLADGLLAPSGDGDVRISPGADASKIIFELEAPDGAAVLEAPAQELAAFLDRSYEQVPGGDEPEWFDFEAEIAKLAFRS